MNLTKLFEMQKVLDDRIVAEKGLQGVDLLDKKILALLTELGELSNEYRGFKFWSEDQEPRTFEPNSNDVCEVCKGDPIFFDNNNDKIIGQCESCDGVGVHFYNPLLEEYVDCFHFILSIGNDRPLNIGGFELLDKEVAEHNIRVYKENTITKQFISINRTIADYEVDYDQETYEELLLRFIGLGGMLGFTTDQIEQAYFEKNKINHIRQGSGY